MEPEELPTDINKSDEQKLSPEANSDKEYMDEFFSGTSGERPVTPGQDSDPVQNSNVQKQIVFPEEAVNGGGDNKVNIDDDSKPAEARSLEQIDCALKELSAQIHDNQIDNKSELQSPVDSGIPPIIREPLPSEPAGDQSDGVPIQEAGDTEFVEERNERESLMDVSNADLVGKENDSRPLEEDSDAENHIAAMNIVQELLNQALEISGSGDGFRPMFHSAANVGEHPAKLPMIEDNGADSGSESMDNRVGQDVDDDDDNDGFHKDSDHELMASCSEGFHIDELTESQQVNDGSEGFHVDQLMASQQVNNSSEGFHVDQLTASQQVNNSSEEFYVDQLMASQQVNNSSEGFHVDQLMASQQVNNSSEEFYVDQLTEIQQAKDSSKGFHVDQLTAFQQVKGSSDGFHFDQETAIHNVSGSDLAEDLQMEDMEEKQVYDVRKPSSSSEQPIHSTNERVSPMLKERNIFESDEHIKYYNIESNSPDFSYKSDDNGNKEPIEKSSSTGFQRFEKYGSSELTPTEDVPTQSLDRQYRVTSTAPEDQTSFSHASENFTDEDWSENERKVYSRIPAVQEIQKHKGDVDRKMVRQIVSGTLPRSQVEFKPPRRPMSSSKNLTGTHETCYVQGSSARDAVECSDISIGGSYLSGGIKRDDFSSRSRPLLTDAQHNTSWSPGVPASPPSSGPIPGYRSLQDQQISWLQMFKILEKQHRKELQSQYVEHQRLIEGIQVQMERDLHKQQESLHQRLEVHREMLSESTVSDIYDTTDRHFGYRLGGGDANISSIHSVEEAGHGLLSSSSMPVRRSLDRDFDSRTPSPSRGYASLDSSVHVSSKQSPRRSPRRSPRKSPVSEERSEYVGEKMLRGGVYSTPMPISRGKNASRSFSSKSENRSLRSIPLSTSPILGEPSNGDIIEPSLDTRAQEVDSHLSSNYDDSYLASSTKLREKHIKAMADLRSYYESELQDLRDSLAITVPLRESARERILQDENREVKRRCDDLEEEIHNTKIRNRDLEQKIHGLEIRASDYADRYDDSQRTVLSLKNRLEELHSYAKDRDQTIEDLEVSLKKQAVALQDAYKKQDQYSESSRREKVTLQRVLEKYEGLEKEYNILKDSTRQTEDKYYDAKNELVDVNKLLSKLELQIKQLNRENDNLRHKATVAMNMASVMTSYEDSFGVVADHRRGLISGRHDNLSTSRSPIPPTTSYSTSGRLTSSEPRQVEEVSDTESEKSGTSPLIKAERELLKLKNQDLSQSLSSPVQKKFYGSDVSCSGKYATEYEYSKKVVQSPKYSVKQSSSKQRGGRVTSTPKQVTRDSRNRPSGDGGGLPKTPPRIQIQPKKYPSPTRFDVELDYRSKLDRQKVPKTVANGDSYPTRSSNDVRMNSRSQTPNKSEGSPKSVAETLERVRAGDFVSRPQWEDVHTSMVKPKPAAEIPIASMTREQRLEERIQTIDKLEKKFTVLQIEKRKIESALTRVPTHGHLRHKEELEDQYDKVDKELGSIRMSLKRFQVIKSTI